MIDVFVAAAAAVEDESTTETMPPEIEDPTVNWTVIVIGMVSLIFYWIFVRPTTYNQAENNISAAQQRRAVQANDPSTQVEGLKALHKSVLNAFYTLLKGGVVVSCGDKYMIAIEFDGPTSGGGIVGEMTFVDTDRKAQAVVKGRKCRQAKQLGTSFLSGEEVVYYNTDDESVFFALLRQYKTRARASGMIDLKSGLPLYNVTIAK